MITLRYLCAESKSLPTEADYKEGITVGDIIKQYQKELSLLVTFSFKELSFITNNHAADIDTVLDDNQELLILKPTSGG